MNLALPFRPKLAESLRSYSGARFWRDFGAGVNVMVMAFPLSVAFAVASGAKPEQGLFTAIIGGGLIAAFSGSRVQIGGPTGALERAHQVLQATPSESRGLSPNEETNTLGSGNGGSAEGNRRRWP